MFARMEFKRPLLFIAVVAMASVMASTAIARRTVKGRITYEIDDNPVEGARVQAWDSDVGSDDKMGEAFTNSDGYYEIHYEGGHWDPAPDWWTIWRPDIYIKVAISSGGRWIDAGSSEVTGNHPHRDDLTKNLAIKGPAIVYGTITSIRDGQPVEGVTVTAFDWDGLSSDDFMGSAVTAANGQYRIEYDRKHWDLAFHWTGLWRPDIYITLAKSGYVIDPSKSGVHWQHRLRDDLRIDRQIDIYPEYVRVTGILQYEDGDSPSASSTTVNTTGIKPIRHASVTLRESDMDEVFSTRTDDNGYFSLVVQRRPDAEYKLIVRPWNYAAKVFRDLDACNEEVWWRRGFRMPVSGNVNLGTMTVGIQKNSGIEGFWQEVEGNFIHDIVCGSPRHDLGNGAAYFNIAETMLLAREYADANRDEDDSIGKVEVAYPDPTYSDNPYSNLFWGEIYIPPPNSAFGHRDLAYHDETLIHEYAHYLSEQISEYDISLSAPATCDESNDETAWSEGFANYLASLLLNFCRDASDPRYLSQDRIDDYFDIEAGTGCGTLNKKVPSAIWSVLWDVADETGGDFPNAVPETHDAINGMHHVVFQIFDKEMDNWVDAPDICEFKDAWKDRYTGPTDWAIDAILSAYGVNCD